MSTQISTETILDTLADYRQRYILSRLLDEDDALPLRVLATALVAWEQNTSEDEVTDDDRDTMLANLHHTHLPKLTDTGFVTYDREASTVAVNDHSVLDEEWVTDLIRNTFKPTDHTRDQVVEALIASRRRTVLAVLGDHTGTISVSNLAAQVAAHEDKKPLIDVTEREHADVLTTLHHIHLPKLADAGLIAYDTAEKTVAARNAPWLEADWLDASPLETLGNAFNRALDIGVESVWTIDGRENIIARGQELFEQADEELFIMVTTDGLLEEGCLARLQDAVDRDVDVYVGSQTKEVRDLVRERVPGATIWEPQLDWVNLPPEREQLGRLVFADREAILLATLGEKDPSGAVQETAITGEGANNSMVVLMREMLGSRLDHLDRQSEDFLEALPL